MESKIMQIFYGNDCLPYKDKDRVVHYPIIGSAFLGASNTTKIRFYIDQIGDENTTWVSVAKLPNGKQGSKVLSVASDENGNYVELELSNWYTQAKGDVYIALQGYQGGVEYTYDSETELYVINGTPTIQTTGSIKLAINYAPIGQVADYNDEFTTYQEILAALGDKIGIENGIVSVELTSILTTDELLNNGAIGLNKPFVLDNMGETLLCYISEDSGTYTLKVIGKDSAYSCSFTSSVLVRNLLGESVLDISYLPVITLTNAMQTLTSSELELANQDNSIIKYNGRVYHKANETTTNYEYVSTDYDISDIGANNQIAKYEISVNKASGSTSMLEQMLNIYSVGEIDALLATKQDRLVSGTNIKTINGQSILGSGDLPIQGGGSVEVDDELSTTSTNPVENRVITNELYNVRAELLGKSNSLSLSYAQALPTSSDVTQFTKFDGTNFTDMTDFNGYVSGLTFKNSDFNDDEEFIGFGSNFYLIDSNLRIVRETDIRSNFKVGQFNIYITEHGVPDRWLAWVSSNSMAFYSLETEKVNLSGYATKTELSESIENLAQPYDDTVIYSIGDKVIYDDKLYSCLVNMSAAETWDSTHWVQITVASGFVDLDKAQVITGKKTFSSEIELGTGRKSYIGSDPTTGLYIRDANTGGGFNTGYISGAGPSLRPLTPRESIGDSSYPWKDLYLSGTEYLDDAKIQFGNSNASGNAKWVLEEDQYDQFLISRIYNNNKVNYWELNGSDVFPKADSTNTIGSSSRRIKDAYIAGVISDGTNSVTVAHLAQNTPTQWYGTQAQYDALGTYDSNTIYNILES